MKIILIFILTCICSIPLRAQQTVASSGKEASGAGGSVSYTVGQISYTTISGTGGSVAQGVQQPYEISVITGLEEAKNITLEWSAYPNPTSNFLTLSLRGVGNPVLKVDNLSYRLYDMYGKLLEEKKIEDKETSIQMGSFMAATYILKIIQTNSVSSRELKTFKIIKY
jgi:hypothetical protein